MTKTEKNREEKKRRVIMPAGIRNKMVAAVSMLLVASIMMVSSTYAWFTLSTAPEVKGITTNVGANGNLEMMLLNGKSFNSTAEDLGVQSDIGDSYSKKDVEAANVTWGNLVDLSANVYGLTNAILNPAKLNIVKGTDGNSNTVNSTMLLAPSYGNDGRVIDVNTETYSGKWSNSAWVYADTQGENAFAGVRVLGTSSGVTKQLSAYRNALNAINSNSNTAKNAIATSLANNGQTLANILVQHIQDETAKFKRTDVETLKKLVDALQTANEAAGEAIKQAVLAYNLSSAAGSLSDDAVDSLVAAIKAAEVTGLSGVTFAKSDDGLAVAITMPTGAEAAVTQWNGNRITQIYDGGGHLIFQTKGDNNTIEDSLTVHESEIVGQYNGAKIAGLGKVFDYLQTSTGFLIVVVVPVALFFIYHLIQFFRVLFEYNNIKSKLLYEQERGKNEDILEDEKRKLEESKKAERERLENELREKLRAELTATMPAQPAAPEIPTENAPKETAEEMEARIRAEMEAEAKAKKEAEERAAMETEIRAKIKAEMEAKAKEDANA